MNNKFVYFFKKSSVFRFFVFLLFFGGLAGAYLYILNLTVKRPHIFSVSPIIVNGGGEITVKGKNFGGKKFTSSWISFDDTVIQSESCLLWTDSEIKFICPDNKPAGLLTVVVQNKNSNPVFVAALAAIPVLRDGSRAGEAPLITSLDKTTAEVGSIIKISGENFGNVKGSSQVVFVPNFGAGAASRIEVPDQKDVLEAAACSEHDFDFVYWSNEELQVRVPDGADSGKIFVMTLGGVSNYAEFTLKNKIGSKTRSNKKTFTLFSEADVLNIRADEKNMMFLKMPLPVETYSQNGLDILSILPTPLAKNYQGVSIHQFENVDKNSKIHIRQEYGINTYEISTKVNPVNIRVNSQQNRDLYKAYTAATELIPADDPLIRQTAAEIVQNERNPYNAVKKIYNYFLNNIAIIPMSSLNAGVPPAKALVHKKADTYDAALLFAAIVRAAGIPAEPIAGIVVDPFQNSFLHWWAEFYIEGFGWIPVDIGMAKAIPFDIGFEQKETMYFGNLDAFRIAFSRGQSVFAPMALNSRVSAKERNYAFSTIWEETAGITDYTASWRIPEVISVY